MSPQMRTKFVTFDVPFRLTAMDAMRPAGTYELVLDEHGTATLFVPLGTGYSLGQFIPVAPLELQELLKLNCCEPVREVGPHWLKQWLSAR